MKFDFRVEKQIKEFLLSLTEKSGWSISKTVEELVIVGLEVKRLGGISIEGLFGLTRPFAYIDSGEPKERLTIWIEEELKQTLESQSDGNLSKELREALKLGVIVLDASRMVIRNTILGIELPLAKIGDIQLEDPHANESLQTLKQILEA